MPLDARPSDHPAVDWAAAYPQLPLEDAEISHWLTRAQASDPPTARHAAFVLGRRVPTIRTDALLRQLPPSLHDDFILAGAGRSGELQRNSFPPSLSAQLTHPTLPTAIWASRARADLSEVPAPTLRRLLASARTEEQITGARLLATHPDLPVDLLDHLPPIPASLAFRALATRPNIPPPAWNQWITSLALRVQANPRAWGNTWLTLAESAPRNAETRSALLTALQSLRPLDLGAPRTTAEFHCTNAVTHDLLLGTIRTIPTCAPDSLRWRSLLALAQYAKEPANPDRLIALQTASGGANGDARVLAAVAGALVTFPPTVARPILLPLTTHRDPGVLAALLEALALHVQHARSLPAQARDQLLHAPFELDEASSLEARLQAIQLARALRIPIPTPNTPVRALQQALHPDVPLLPAPTIPHSPHDEGDLVITTALGRITIAIDPRSAREASRVVIEFARSGRYDGTLFHRIVPSFVAQGGDPRGDGYGGTTRITPTELSGENFTRGAVGIALAGLDTGGTQFFIVTADAPHLNARYPWIGRVTEGMDVVDELMAGDSMRRVEFIPSLRR